MASGLRLSSFVVVVFFIFLFHLSVFSFAHPLEAVIVLLLGLLPIEKILGNIFEKGNFYHGVVKSRCRNFPRRFSLKFLSIFSPRILNSIEPITPIWVSLERSYLSVDDANIDRR